MMKSRLRFSIKFSVLLLLRPAVSLSFAQSVLQEEKITISDVPGFMTVDTLRAKVLEQNSRPGSNISICSEIQEVPGSFLCVYNSRQQMNEAFTRAGFYWGTGKGYPKGTLLPNDSPVLKRYNKYIRGQNLTGEILADFYKSSFLNPMSSAKPNADEKEFYDSFIENPKISSLEGAYTVISFAVHGSDDYQDTVNHEINHAKYYLWTWYKTAVDQFWKTKVTNSDKVAIRTILGRIYNAKNETTMIDESQAYILETGSEKDLLARFATKYGDRLRKQLDEATPLNSYRPNESSKTSTAH